jgi:hypothetical protein
MASTIPIVAHARPFRAIPARAGSRLNRAKADWKGTDLIEPLHSVECELKLLLTLPRARPRRRCILLAMQEQANPLGAIEQSFGVRN